MPNGHDRNWTRLCAAVDGFRARFGRWPTCVAMERGYLDDLQRMFNAQDLATIQGKIELRLREGAHMIAADDAGNAYDYGQEGFSDSSEHLAMGWFGVEPIDEDPY